VTDLLLRRRNDHSGGISVPAGESAAKVAEAHFAGTADQIVAVTASTGEVRYGRRDPAGRFLGFEPRGETAERLDLLPHPEGGWYRRTWASEVTLEPPGYGGSRPTGTAIYFLLRPGESSRWHRVRSTELYLWHRGGPLALRFGGTGSAPLTTLDPVTLLDPVTVLGPDLAAGQQPQLVIPAGTWQTATPAMDAEVLCSCVVSPGFDFADFSVPAD
jgi:hypothetical protein